MIFALGVILGSLVGFLTAALMAIAADADDFQSPRATSASPSPTA